MHQHGKESLHYYLSIKFHHLKLKRTLKDKSRVDIIVDYSRAYTVVNGV